MNSQVVRQKWAHSDEQNVVLAEQNEVVEGLLAQFYGRFPYPWRPQKFDYLMDREFEPIMLNQDIGDWEHAAIPSNPRIWVAGCGTNQALITAMRFRDATVVGSDVSGKSLAICRTNAEELGVTNLVLREESINNVPYAGEFDYIISTGVIHHNSQPDLTLAKIATALKKDGIIELMVYNRFHRLVTSAFQKAVRILGGDLKTVDLDLELSIAKSLVQSFPTENLLSSFLATCRDREESSFADALIHPVEHSYTVESLEAIAEACGLEIVAPCLDIFDKIKGTYIWDLEFSDADLQRRYEALPDTRRWQASNLLLLEKSPLLWFYFQRKDSGRPRKSERVMCNEFLNTVFARNQTELRSYILGDDGFYHVDSETTSYPAGLPPASVRSVIQAVDGVSAMGEILERLGITPTFSAVNAARLNLTTTAFPFLRAVGQRRGDVPMYALSDSGAVAQRTRSSLGVDQFELDQALSQVDFE